jgi:iron complex transport system substrate-binding protein
VREINQITGQIVDAAYRLHTTLGPGLVESAYRLALMTDLTKRGLKVEQEKHISFEYQGIQIINAFRLDLLVEGRVVAELKSLEKLAPVHRKQILTYLRLLDLPVGLLINFGAARMNEGLHRIVNDRSSLAATSIVAGRRSR